MSIDVLTNIIFTYEKDEIFDQFKSINLAKYILNIECFSFRPRASFMLIFKLTDNQKSPNPQFTQKMDFVIFGFCCQIFGIQIFFFFCFTYFALIYNQLMAIPATEFIFLWRCKDKCLFSQICAKANIKRQPITLEFRP